MRYNGKRASTEDFRKLILEITGSDLQWFFDQWIYGNQHPTYVVAWKKEQITGGNWKVTLRVKQKNVPDDFTMLLPIKIQSSDKSFARMRLQVTGPNAEVVLPHFSFEPDDVIFNDLTSVLCDVETEGY